MKRTVVPPRRTRTDAQRNRARILEVAKAAFTRDGANTSLDDIAKEAGVGPGTLYRHFPTRDVLIEAVYFTEVEKIAAAERRFAATMAPIPALRAWMRLFVDYVAAKHLIAPALNAFVANPSKLYESSRPQIGGALEALVQRAIKSGELRKDLDAFDLLRALIGVCSVAPSANWQQSAKRVVDILIAGSRPTKS
ncbi:MAG TPA: TetR/AcrR family transcriptional regulator [Candidatus Acidoferrales bacterium]